MHIRLHKKNKRLNKIQPDYLRSIMFGFEDALVSTAGVVVGMSIGTTHRNTIILAGLITIAVEALSMGAGEYLSENSVHELRRRWFFRKNQDDSAITSGLLMFGSYFLGGLIPLMPVFFFEARMITVLSAGFALVGLAILGYLKGLYVQRSPGRSALETFLVGGTAAAIGMLVGLLLRET